MIPEPTRSVVARRVWTLVLVAVGAVCAAPASSWASCGDYLETPLHRLPRLITQRPDDRSDHAPRPCQGPSCRQSLPPGMPTAPVFELSVEKQWMTGRIAALPELGGGSARPAATDQDRGVAHPLRLERPPC